MAKIIDENKRRRACAISLVIPPGDYTKIKNSKKLNMAISNDMTEFMSISDNPTMFYVCVKNYLSERLGLYKMLAGNSVVEATIHATIVSLMAQRVGGMLNSMENDEPDDEEHRKSVTGALNELRAALKSEERMKNFDEYACAHYGVGYGEALDDNGDPYSIDSHIQANS